MKRILALLAKSGVSEFAVQIYIVIGPVNKI